MADLRFIEARMVRDWKQAAQAAIARLTPPGTRVEVAPGAVSYQHGGRQWVLSRGSPGILELTLAGPRSWSLSTTALMLMEIVCPEVLLADLQDRILQKDREAPDES